MKTSPLFATNLLIAFVFSLGLAINPPLAQAGFGSFTIEQVSDYNVYGTWTLINPLNKETVFDNDKYILEEARAGKYTLLVESPKGAETNIYTFLDNDLLDTKTVPQATFTIDSGTNYTIRIEHVFTRVGNVGVNSEPSGLEFTLQGPNNFKLSGQTPASYERLPEGLYSVKYHKITDCIEETVQSDRLQKDSRIGFNLRVSCENMDFIQQQNYESSLKFVTTIIEGKTVTFSDLKTEDWYAPYASRVMKSNIMSGYKDERGKLTGEFGPGNNVTLAELLKIAHRVSDIQVDQGLPTPKNIRARGTWFEAYMSSAENLDWLVFSDPRLDPGRPATRGEVVATLLQSFDVRRFWPKGDLFSDVSRSTPYSASIETAALDGLVDGYDNGTFGANDPINRAEIAKMLSAGIDLYIAN